MDIFVYFLVWAICEIFCPSKNHPQVSDELSDYALLGGTEALRDDIEMKESSGDPYLDGNYGDGGCDW